VWVAGTMTAEELTVSGSNRAGVLVTKAGHFEARRSQIIMGNARYYAPSLRIEGDEPDDGGDTDGGDTDEGTGTGAEESSGGGSSESGAVDLEMQQAANAMPYAYLENCFVTQRRNTGAEGAAVVTHGRLDLLHTTIGSDDGVAVHCDETSAVTARNSLLVTTAAATLACETMSTTTSYVEGNVDLSTWFVEFTFGARTTDLRLNDPPLAVYSAARWEAGDPTTDIDGDPRVALEGAMDVAGADVPASGGE